MRWLMKLTALLVLLVALSVPAAAQEPRLSVTSPTNDQVIDGFDVTIEFEVEGIQIVPSSVPVSEAGQRPEANNAGEGHLHIMLDLQPLVVWDSNSPYTFENVPPGEHELMIELAQNDHSSFTPPVMHHIRFQTMGPQLVPASGSPPSKERDLAPITIVLIAIGLSASGLGLWRRWSQAGQESA